MSLILIVIIGGTAMCADIGMNALTSAMDLGSGGTIIWSIMEGNEMLNLTVFSKTMKSREGRSFEIYLSRITNKKTGEELPVRVQFSRTCTAPQSCPCIIMIEQHDAHLSTKSYTTESGESRVTYTLWINAYTLSAEPYVDHSLDEFF